MKALILAAGFGTRLRPWTDEKAKPLIPVAGVEALFHALYRVQSLGIKEVFINTHYKAEQVETAAKEFQGYFPSLKIQVSHEEEILGSAGAVLKVIHEFNCEGGLVVLNGDTLSSLDTKLLLHSESSTFAASDKIHFFERYNPLFVNERGEWTRESSSQRVHFLGTYFLHAKDLETLKKQYPRPFKTDLFHSVYELLEERGRPPVAIDALNALRDFWFDLTSIDYVIEARARLSGEYYPYWEDVLRLRHPSLDPQSALKFWPLKFPSDR